MRKMKKRETVALGGPQVEEEGAREGDEEGEVGAPEGAGEEEGPRGVP